MARTAGRTPHSISGAQLLPRRHPAADTFSADQPLGWLSSRDVERAIAFDHHRCRENCPQTIFDLRAGGSWQCGSRHWYCQVSGEVGRIFSAGPRQRKYDIASDNRKSGYPPPDGGVDQLYRPPLATGLVLASAGAPAYSEVTFAWAIFFTARLFLQFSLFENQDVNSLAVTDFVTGWPATILLLAFSYLYGTWRLAQLRGPSVEEFRNATPAPWQSQRRGF